MIADTGRLEPGTTRVRYDNAMLAGLGYVGVITAVDPDRPHVIRVRCDSGYELWTSSTYWNVTPTPGGTR